MEQAQAGIGDEPAAAEVAQAGLALQRRNSAVAGRRAHQVHVLDPLARAQVGDAGVGDPALPCHVERAQIRQVGQDGEPGVGELDTRRSRRCICGMRRRVSKASVGQLPRPAQPQARHVREAGDACEHRVGHQSVGFERRDATLLHDRNEPIPLRVGQLPPWRDGVVRRVDLECVDGRRACDRRLRQRGPTAVAGVLRDSSCASASSR